MIKLELNRSDVSNIINALQIITDIHFKAENFTYRDKLLETQCKIDAQIRTQ